MDFQRSVRRQSAGLSRGVQWRLIGLIFLLGLVIVAIDQAARPELWGWVAGPDERMEAAFPSDAAVAGEDGNANAAPPESEDLQDASAGSPDGTESQYVGFVPAWTVADVRDDWVSLTRGEARGLAAIAEELRTTQHGTLARAARKDVTFAVLVADSPRYRGQVVRVRGQLRRRLPFVGPAELADMGLTESWVFGDDAGGRAFRILTTNETATGLGMDAATLPTGPQFDPVPVVLDGVFFKRTAYASEGGTSLAPLLIARRIAPVAAPSARPADRLSGVLPAFVLAAIGCVALAFVRMLAGQKRRRIAFEIGRSEPGEPLEIDADSPAEYLSRLRLSPAETAADDSPPA